MREREREGREGEEKNRGLERRMVGIEVGEWMGER